MVELSWSTEFSKPIVLGLGFFDCVHTGHRALIQTVLDTAQKSDAVPCIATFSNNPYRLFNPDAKVINLYSERLGLLKSMGIEYVMPFQFDAGFKKTDREEFLDKLFRSFRIHTVVCGYDYLFGAGGKGDAEFLKSYASRHGATAVTIDRIELLGERVSSTAVKSYIERGDLERANLLLTQPFFITGTVVKGRGEGRKLGYPTANIVFKKNKLVPPDGVYQTRTTALGKEYRSVTHIGTRPTFGDSKKTVETHLVGFSGELGGKEIRVEFLKRLRDVQPFETPQLLIQQIEKDLHGS